MANNNNDQKVQDKVILNVKESNIVGKQGLDLSSFKGTNSKVESVNLQVFNQGTADERYAFVVESESFMIEEFECRAKEYVTAWTEDDKATAESVFNFSTSINSNASKLMRHFDVKTLSELVGKEIEVRRKVSDNGKERIGIFF